MNRKLAAAAERAMRDPNVESKRGYCSRFVRQVAESVFGTKYDFLFKDSAIHTGAAFLHNGFAEATRDAGPLEVGDILFKLSGSGGYGHVGIYTGIGEVSREGKVAENSSTKIGRIKGGKGYRTLKQFGTYQAVGRLPED